MDNVSFHSIGGLEEHIQYLKDNILLPWKYDNVLKKFHVKPPRGVLFHGPPGTGKTLTAAALANECKRNRQKVTFYHQNAAECLNMWLGESERKLRELFKTAYLNRPSIIFFDELDALAPTRSVRMDHVHSSLVATLLTLMDGLKSPTDVVVIGSTNRLDEIDPALRRPGRFDKELFFPPPALEARRAILDIHTRYWQTDVSSEFMDNIAENTVGYCGADLEALCKEALMCAMKRCDASEQRVTAKNLTVHEEDFIEAKTKFMPAFLRSSISPVCSLREVIRPLLKRRVDDIMQQMEKHCPLKFLFPKQRYRLEMNDKILFCPRVLLTGSADQGLTTHLAPAILHRLEHLPVHLFDVTTLFNYADFSCIEALMSQRLATVRMQQPCIMYVPDITEFWDLARDGRAIFLRMMNYFDSSTEVLLLATAHVPYTELPDSLKKIFPEEISLIVTMTNPTKLERLKFFEPLFERKRLHSSMSMQQINSGMSADDAGSSSEQLNEAYKEPEIKTCCSRRSWSLGFIPDVSLEENLEDTHKPQRLNKRCLHQNEYNKKRIRSETPEPTTSYRSEYETSMRRDLSLPEKERLFWANPAEGCEVTQDDKIQQLLGRLVTSTENNTVHSLEILYNKIIMAIKKHTRYNNYSYLKDLEDIIEHCEKEHSGVSE